MQSLRAGAITHPTIGSPLPSPPKTAEAPRLAAPVNKTHASRSFALALSGRRRKLDHPLGSARCWTNAPEYMFQAYTGGSNGGVDTVSSAE